MKSLSSVGLGLSIVFGCLLLALVGEVYYLLWRKRRRITSKVSGDNNSHFLYMFCLKKPSYLRQTTQELCSSVGVVSDTFVHNNDHLQEPNNEDGQLEENWPSKDLLLNKPYGEEQMEAELIRLHGLSGPPRFLFTIVEETKEDLESEDGRSRRSGSHNKRSLSDLLLSVETPYLTPIASPSFFTPPLTPVLDRYRASCEVSKDAEFNRMRSSPPPRFKFLQDAEEKLVKKKLMEEAEKKVADCSPKSSKVDEEEGNYITINVVDKDREKEAVNQNGHHYQLQHYYYSSSSSQVMPLDSSPFKQPNQEPRELIPSLPMKSS